MDTGLVSTKYVVNRKVQFFSSRRRKHENENNRDKLKT